MHRIRLRTALLIVPLVIGFAVPSTASAQKRAIQLGLFAPVQIFPEEDTIAGVRISLLYGSNAAVYGVDLGIVNRTTVGDMRGYQFGIVGLAESNMMGVQDNLVNITRGKASGVQSGIFNLAGSAGGFQYGAANVVEKTGRMRGFQLGIVNYGGDVGGFQLGIVNVAENMNGFQLAVVNVANRTHGLQIGLVNVISHGGAFTFFPIVNWSF